MIYVLLPAYNEEQALTPLAEKIDKVMTARGTAYRIIVVDDGSRDGTAHVLQELRAVYPIDVITHRYNRGLGETARDGFEHIAAVAAPQDIVVRMDCDDTHDPAYIPAMVGKLDEGYEVVTTSRYVPGGGQIGVKWYRRTTSRAANILLKAFFPIPGLKEYTCGFRAYRAAVVQDAVSIFGNSFIDLKGMGFTGTVEKMIKFKLMGARVAEIPFVLRSDRKQSASKSITTITALGYLILIAKYCAYWGDIGREWRRQIEDRKRRVYGSDGHLLEREGIVTPRIEEAVGAAVAASEKRS